jgi:hypothetical protein
VSGSAESMAAGAGNGSRPTQQRPVDPMLWYVIGTDVPVAFWDLEPTERSLRLRFRLVAWCAGVSDLVAWHLAMDATDEGLQAIVEVVSLWPDERLRRALADARQRRAAGLPPRSVFEG